jgi:hypothetical protein
MKKQLLLLSVSILAAVFANAVASGAEDAGGLHLIDGGTLDGWEQHGQGQCRA